MTSWLKLLHLLLAINLLLAAKLNTREGQTAPTTVLQANHFYSSSSSQTTYNIDKINVDLSLIVVLRPKDKQFFSNPTTLTLTSGSNQVQCQFETFDSVCVLEKVPKAQTKMKIKCDKTPCEVFWTIYQTPLKQLNITQSIDQLYSVKETNRHSIAMIKCNNPDFKELENSVTLHSENNFTRVYTNNVIYFLFHKQKKGHVFFKFNDDLKACGELSFYSIPQKMLENTITRQFVTKQDKSVFKLGVTPKDDFRIDCSIHQLLRKQAVKSNLEIQLTGVKSSQRATIVKSVIFPYGQKQTYDFSYVVSKLDSQWKDIQFEFKSSDKIIMLNARLSLIPIAQVQRGEVSFFTLKKGQILKYQINKEQNASAESKTFITASYKDKIKLSTQECKSIEGCNFTLSAEEDIQLGSIYISSQEKAVEGQKPVIYQMGRSVTKKIAQDDVMYFMKTIPAKKYVQVVVNTPNVIIYAADKLKCETPTEECYQKVGNNHHAFIYQTQVQTVLMIGVVGLDNCVFTLTVMLQDDVFVKLQDGVAFSYEMDDMEKQLIFRFTLKEKQGVAFNLISPLHSLNMLVSNSKQTPKGDQNDLKSIDGYLYMTHDQVENLEFSILVQKTPEFQTKYVHFSIIASTNGANMQLEPSISHYQTLDKNQKRQFAFEFDTKKDYIVNFYIHNAVNQPIQVKLDVANQDDKWTEKTVQSFDIQRSTDHLNLKDVSKQLCHLQGQNTCQIFLRLSNNMDREIDITVTLIVEDSVIELKDGLWQSYTLNKISSTSHFYFFPRHENKSVTILYKSSFADLRIGYAIWKAQDRGIDPTEWPFPVSAANFQSNARFSYRPTKHVNISPKSLKQCWPSCVVLVSLVQDTSKPPTYQDQNDNFSILISNNLVQIPQKTKLDIILQSNQQKFFLIDLKSVVVKTALTIFSSSTMGYQNIYGTVYSENNPRCPTESQSDFEFGRLETQIKAATIQKHLQDNNMASDNNVYLCIMAQAISTSKFYIEWTSDDSMIKVLEMDSFQTIKVEKGDKKMFQITPRMHQYELKFTRTRGFPYIEIVNCKGGDQGYQQCLDKFDGSTKVQMLRKTQMFSQNACSNCIIFVQITSEEPAQLDLHIQSKFSQVQLKENHIISDFTEKDQSNRYTLSYLSDRETIISVHVLQGDPQITINNFHDINIKKTKPKGSDLIHIVIPPAEHVKPQEADKQKSPATNLLEMLGVTHYGPDAFMGTMKFLHITIKSVKSSSPSSYTITYSSGERQTYLQDGMALDYTLDSNKQTIFYYENINEKTHAILTISMPDSAALYNLQMTMYYYTDPLDEDTRIQFTPQKPPMRKKTPNPTIVYNLPSNHKLFAFHFTNPNTTPDKISLIINHLQVILLPYNMQFPFQLAANQSLNFIVDSIKVGYVQINIRKCDDSSPQFGYTFDEPAFQKGEYSYTTTLNDDPHFQQVVKINQIGAMYMMMKASQQPSLLSIKVTFSDAKIKGSKAKAGNRGVLQYQLLNSQQAEISFTGAVCEGKCPNDVNFFTISSTQMKSLYSQTVCPSAFFSTDQFQSIKPLNLTKIENKPDSNNKISFSYKLLDHISYLSVKGVYGSGEEVYYRPIEIVTLWGQLTRTSQSHKFAIGFFIIFVVCGILICVRRSARKGYRPLQERD